MFYVINFYILLHIAVTYVQLLLLHISPAYYYLSFFILGLPISLLFPFIYFMV